MQQNTSYDSCGKSSLSYFNHWHKQPKFCICNNFYNQLFQDCLFHTGPIYPLVFIIKKTNIQTLRAPNHRIGQAGIVLECTGLTPCFLEFFFQKTIS